MENFREHLGALDGPVTGPADGARFVVQGEHARGGLGVVLKAVDLELNRTVAIKQLQERLEENHSSRTRFLAEARITGRLEHPGVVPVYALGRDPSGRMFYAMRFIEGRTLRDVVIEFHAEGGWSRTSSELELRKLLQRFIDVCNTLEFAHDRGIIHRDIKPSNIMLGPYGETLVVDWGIAKSVSEPEPEPISRVDLLEEGDSTETIPGTTMGTPQYMSPEQAAGDIARVGKASDIFSLGATLYAILVGRPPYQVDGSTPVLELARQGRYPPPRQVEPAVPKVLEAIVQRAMALDAAARYPSPRALSEALEHWLADESVPGIEEPWGQRLSRWERRNRSLVRAVGVGLLAATGLAIAAAIFIDRSRVEERRLRVEVKEQKRFAERQRQEAIERGLAFQRQTSSVLLADGLTLSLEGQVGEGLMRMAQALEGLPPGTPGLERLIRKSIGSWRRVLCEPAARFVHGDRVRGAISPDGSTVATASDDGTARVWDAKTGLAVSPVLKHPGEVNWVEYHPSGERVATACSKGGAWIWDARSGALIHQLEHATSLDHVIFSRDGTRVLTSCVDGAARLWDAQSGMRIGENMEHEGEVLHAIFSPDDTRIATASEDNSARIWDAQTGQPLTLPLTHGDLVDRVAFSPDGTLLGTTCADGLVRIWNVASGQLSAEPFRHRDRVNSIVFHPGGKSVLTTSTDGTTVVWDLGASQARLTLRTSRAPMSWAGFDPAGERIATASRDGTARIWDADTGEPISTPMVHNNWVYQALWLPDGRRIFTTSRDFSSVIWELPREGEPRQVASTIGPIRVAVADLAGVHLALGSPGGAVAIGRLVGGATLQELSSMPSEVSALDFSPDGRLLAGGTMNGTLRVWSVESSRQVVAPERFPGWIHSVRFSPDGRQLLVAGSRRIGPGRRARRGVAVVWDTTTWEALGPPMEHSADVWRAVYSADGQWIATAGVDRTARIWRAADRQPVGSPLPHDSEVWTVEFHPSGEEIVTSGQENVARVWRLDQTRNPVLTLRHPKMVRDARYSRDGEEIYTACEDGLVRIWDTATGRQIGPGLLHPPAATNIAPLADGRRLLVTAGVECWITDLPTPEKASAKEVIDWLEARIGVSRDEGTRTAPRVIGSE
jgi:WD40 repeat protein/tRNA A-37 threonylcarbamoyl transferase component Bud32